MNFLNSDNPGFYEEASFLNVKAIVKWKREKKYYNFEGLPKTAILVVNPKLIRTLSKPFSKKIKGIPGTGRLLSSSLLLCSSQGSGAPGALVLLEELRVLGVENIIFIGSAGIIGQGILEQQAFVTSKAFSTVGSSFFYAKEDVVEPKDSNWYQKINEHLNLPSCTSWSTDCPYRETPSLIAKFKRLNAQLVDMESAAVYAFCNFHKLNAVCLLIAADSLLQKTWEPPKRPDLLFKRQKEIIAKIISFSSLPK